MYKIIIIILSIFVGVSTNAQEKKSQAERQAIIDARKLENKSVFEKDGPCRNIKVENKELEGEIIYSTKMDLENSIHLIRTKNLEKNSDIRQIIFYINANTRSQDRKGLYMKLSNGEILRFENVEVNVSNSSTSSNLSMGAYLIVDDELYNKFSQYGIIQISLGGTNKTIKEKLVEKNKEIIKCAFDPNK